MMHCAYCGVAIRSSGLLPSLFAQKGLRYGDGRIICHPCHHTAVKNESQLQVVLQHVKRCFQELGLVVQWHRLPIRLKDQPQMRQLAGSDQTVGVAQYTINGRQVDSTVSMLYGMPAALAVETLAHEAAHVWCREQGVDFAPDTDNEEGFCNVIGCLALQQLGRQYDAPMRVADMFRNPDPVYGERFRQQWAYMRSHGWNQYRLMVLDSCCALHRLSQSCYP